MSRHVSNPLPVRVEQVGPRAIRLQQMCGLIAVVGLVLCIVGFIVNREQFFQSYLFAFIYWGGFSIGGLGVLLIHHTVGGKWGVTIRRLLEAQMRTLWVTAALIIPLLIFPAYVYPWANHDLVARTAILQYKSPYLNLPFFIARVVLYFIIWLFWGLRVNRMADRQDETGDSTLRERMRAFSAPGVLVFTLTGTFAYIDWILSCDAQFYSTVYGALLLIGDVLQTFALSILVLVLTSSDDRFEGRVNSKILHDLGNLLFAFTIFWTYLSASQLIIIWPANLPQELNWYLDRIRGFWLYVTVTIALCMFAIPFCLLLSQERKRNPIRLRRVAVFILCARVIDLFWIVEPTFRNKGFALYWTDFAAFLAVGGIWVYAYIGQLRQRPLLPLRDPRVSEPIPEAVA